MLKNKSIKDRLVPIIADEARTFGMEGLFRQIGIYSPNGQQYTPQDREQVAYYKEDEKGQILQEGINELGAGFFLAGRSDLLQHQQPADDSVLHLLLDVRVPAYR
jgi:pyruvate dehydrogenase E1 component